VTSRFVLRIPLKCDAFIQLLHAPQFHTMAHLSVCLMSTGLVISLSNVSNYRSQVPNDQPVPPSRCTGITSCSLKSQCIFSSSMPIASFSNVQSLAWAYDSTLVVPLVASAICYYYSETLDKNLFAFLDSSSNLRCVLLRSEKRRLACGYYIRRSPLLGNKGGRTQAQLKRKRRMITTRVSIENVMKFIATSL
jgi:hypothetical protein